MPWETGAAPGRSPRPAPRGPRLRVLPRAQRVPGNRFLVLVAGLLVSGLIGLLVLNLSMQKGAFELAAIQQRTADLRTHEQALAYDMQRLESTQHLWRRATALGMVRNTSPVFLDLTDGSIIGDPVPAPAQPPPEHVTDTSARQREDPPPSGDIAGDTAGDTDGSANQPGSTRDEEGGAGRR